MANLVIPAKNSLTITDKNPRGNINSDTIFIGYSNNYFHASYLYFDTSSIPDNISLNAAHLVLFKYPVYPMGKNYNYMVYPLLDYFSTQTNYENPCLYDNTTQVSFYPFNNKIYLEIDITKIIELWNTNKLVNKGLILTTENYNSSLISFGSANVTDSTLKPFLRLNYEDKSSGCQNITMNYPKFYINCTFPPLPYPNINVKCKLRPGNTNNE